jgi:hypothetical protein
MSWVKLDNAAHNRVDGVTIRISRKNERSLSGHMIVRIARDIAEKGGLKTDAKSRVNLLLGEGPNAGRMLVVARVDGAFRCRVPQKNGAVTIDGVVLAPYKAAFFEPPLFRRHTTCRSRRPSSVATAPARTKSFVAKSGSSLRIASKISAGLIGPNASCRGNAVIK